MSDLKQRRFEEILSNPFNLKNFVEFLRELLNDMKVGNPANKIKKDLGSFYEVIDYYNIIGKYEGNDKSKIVLFSICLKNNKNLENARSMQRAFVKNLLIKNNCDGALVAFYTDGNLDKWRLSLVRLDYEFSKGKVSEKITPAKRYSYLVGKGEPCHTAKVQLFPIFKEDDINPSLDDLEEAFSVETVTSEFFEEYKDKYNKVKESLDQNEDFISESEKGGFTSEQFAKKLMGQIVFLYFIQKKGWLGVQAFPSTLPKKKYDEIFFKRGQKARDLLPKVYKKNEKDVYIFEKDALLKLSKDDEIFLSTLVIGNDWGTGPKNFMRRIFDGYKKNNKKSNFFDDYLEPLFYKGLNEDRGDNAFFQPLHCRIPFLNGGLFEQMEGYDWEKNDFLIPDDLFSNVDIEGKDNADGILDIFDRYNFTMAEDEPMEREVAIDPEMLGKVFESLLDVTDRKSKGAFYTPREIVHYMCQEAIINYLVTKTGIEEGDIRKFILYGEYFRDEDIEKNFISNEIGIVSKVFNKNKKLEIPETILSFKKDINKLKEIDDYLANVKIVDLAVGSGAFPLGMLNEIVKARDVITSYMSIDLSYNQVNDLRNSRSFYCLKRETIKNSIFACDIEASATDITKLRLWLSLVIDNFILDEKDDPYGIMRKPRELPNLDCNIICGNSLVDEFEGVKLFKNDLITYDNEDSESLKIYDFVLVDYIKKLIELQSLLFDEKDHKKKGYLKEQIQNIYNEIVIEQVASKRNSLKEDYLKAIKNISKPFVLWQLYFPKVFRDNGGFDIVIGNPPYVGEKGNKELFRPIAATDFGHRFYYGKMDLFYFFFHKAIDLGTNNAEIAFITTNYYPTAFGGKILREDFKKRIQIRKLINFNELKIFESALGQHNMITFLTKYKKVPILAYNSKCKIDGIADNKILNTILYSNVSSHDYFDTFHVKQDNLYEGKENYIRLIGCGDTEDNTAGSVLSKIASSDKFLKDIAFIKQGIVSGADKYTDSHEKKYHLGLPKGKGIFILRKNELIDLQISPNEKCYIKEVYKNSQISKYHIDYKHDLYVLYITRNFRSKNAPTIIRYLKKFTPILQGRLETYNESYPWYSLHREREVDIFEAKEKIVNSRRAKSNIFALETKKCYEQSDIMITVIKDEYKKMYPPKYVLGLLNSSLYYVWLKNKGKLKGNMLEMYGAPLEEIPIPTVSECTVKSVVNFVDKLLVEPNNKKVYHELDMLIYGIFGLSKDEINIVENLAHE